MASQPVGEHEPVAVVVPTLTHEQKWTVVYNNFFDDWYDTFGVPQSGTEILRPLVRRNILGIKIPDTDEGEEAAWLRIKEWRSVTSQHEQQLEFLTGMVTERVRADLNEQHVREQAEGRL